MTRGISELPQDLLRVVVVVDMTGGVAVVEVLVVVLAITTVELDVDIDVLVDVVLVWRSRGSGSVTRRAQSSSPVSSDVAVKKNVPPSSTNSAFVVVKRLMVPRSATQRVPATVPSLLQRDKESAG